MLWKDSSRQQQRTHEYMFQIKVCSTLVNLIPSELDMSTHQVLIEYLSSSKAKSLDNPSVAKWCSAKQDSGSRVLSEYNCRASIVTLGYKATRGSTGKREGGGTKLTVFYSHALLIYFFLNVCF